jgi:PIN like domain
VPPEPKPRPHADFRFYVDEDILGVGYGMMWLRPDVTTCGREPFAERLPRGILDVDWIPVVADLGLIAITNNHKIRTHPVEAEVALSSNARMIGLAGKIAEGTSWDKVTLLTRHWRAIEAFVDDHPTGPWWLSVSQTEAKQVEYRAQRSSST